MYDFKGRGTMKLKLNKKELFWSLIDPMDVEKVLVILNESTPEADVNYEKLPKWAKAQIAAASKTGKLSTDPEIKLEASKKKVTKKVTKKATSKKKVAKHVS